MSLKINITVHGKKWTKERLKKIRNAKEWFKNNIKELHCPECGHTPKEYCKDSTHLIESLKLQITCSTCRCVYTCEIDEKEEMEYIALYSGFEYPSEQIEVIGNIHDNH